MCGPAKLIIFDLHELSIRFQIKDNLIPILASAQARMLTVLGERFDFEKERFVFVFPDAGSAKRYSHEFKGLDTVYCLKVFFYQIIRFISLCIFFIYSFIRLFIFLFLSFALFKLMKNIARHTLSCCVIFA